MPRIAPVIGAGGGDEFEGSNATVSTWHAVLNRGKEVPDGLQRGLDLPDKKKKRKAWKAKAERQIGEGSADTPWWPVEDNKRLWVWKIFEEPENNKVSHYMNLYVLCLILAGAVITVVETTPGLHNMHDAFFNGLETFFVINFSAEFMLRLICCPDYGAFSGNFMNWIDCISIIPFYLELALKGTPINLQVLRVLRTGRALRMVKLGRYSSGIRLIQNSLVESMDALQLFACIFGVLVIVFASAVYYTERGDDTKCDYNTYPCSASTVSTSYIRTSQTSEGATGVSPFQSIPDSVWWTIVTMVTVGYGDVFPETWAGYTVGMFAQLTGVIMLALPLSIVGANFHEERQKIHAEQAAEKAASEEPDEEEDVRGCVDSSDNVNEMTDLYTAKLLECLIKVTECSCAAVDLTSHNWNVITDHSTIESHINGEGSPLKGNTALSAASPDAVIGNPDGTKEGDGTELAALALEPTAPPARLPALPGSPAAALTHTPPATPEITALYQPCLTRSPGAGGEYRKVTADVLDEAEAKIAKLLASFKEMNELI